MKILFVLDSFRNLSCKTLDSQCFFPTDTLLPGKTWHQLFPCLLRLRLFTCACRNYFFMWQSLALLIHYLFLAAGELKATRTHFSSCWTWHKSAEGTRKSWVGWDVSRDLSWNQVAQSWHFISPVVTSLEKLFINIWDKWSVPYVIEQHFIAFMGRIRFITCTLQSLSDWFSFCAVVIKAVPSSRPWHERRRWLTTLIGFEDLMTGRLEHVRRN